MKSMLLTPEEKKEMATESVLTDRPNYPYGLKIHLDDEAMKKLGMTKPPAADAKFNMIAKVEVCSIHKENYSGDVNEYSIGLQITDMDLVAPVASTSPSEALYGDKQET